MTYAEYLRSPHWRRVRRAYRESDLPQVCHCGETEVDLHHTTYERLGRERLTDLVPLCRGCHQAVHALHRRGDIGLDLAGLYSDERAAAYAAEQQPARARAAEEFAAASGPAKQRGRSMHKRLTLAVHRATRAGIDPTPYLDRIESALAAAEVRLA